MNEIEHQVNMEPSDRMLAEPSDQRTGSRLNKTWEACQSSSHSQTGDLRW